MFKNKIFIAAFILLFILASIVFTNSLNYKLKKYLSMSKFNGAIGIAVAKDNKITTINNKKYPMLSIFKYFVAIKVLKDLENKNIPLNQQLTVKKNMIDTNTYSPMLKKYTTYPIRISIAELLKYMICESDNNACDILIEYTGGINQLEKFVHNIGFTNIEISVNEKKMNREIAAQYLNKSTPKDIILIMKYIKETNFLSKQHLIYLDTLMGQTTTGSNKLKAGLPSNITLYHKTGSGSRTPQGIKIADNDAGYVVLSDGTVYYIAVMIKDSNMSDDDNAKIISTISNIIYNHYSKQ